MESPCHCDKGFFFLAMELFINIFNHRNIISYDSITKHVYPLTFPLLAHCFCARYLSSPSLVLKMNQYRGPLDDGVPGARMELNLCAIVTTPAGAPDLHLISGVSMTHKINYIKCLLTNKS